MTSTEQERFVSTYLDALRGRAKYESVGFMRALGNVKITFGSGLFIEAWEAKTDNHFSSLRFRHAQRGLEADYGALGWRECGETQ